MTAQEAQQLRRLQVQLRRIAASREAGVEAQIQQTFQSVLGQLQQILTRYYLAFGSNENATLSGADLRAMGQYQNFLRDVMDGLDGISAPIDGAIRAAIEDAYTVTYSGMVRGVTQAAAGTAELHTALSGLGATTPEIVRDIVENPMSKLKLSTILRRRRQQIVQHAKKTIAVGLSNGDSYTRMANRIAESLEGDYRKAMRIVRTEAHRAISRGFEDVAQEINSNLQGTGYIYVKTWRSRGDQKVRDTHRHLDGTTILVSEEFESHGKKAPCPCQFGVPEEDINCRCMVTYRFLTPEEFEAAGGKLPMDWREMDTDDGLTSGGGSGIMNTRQTSTRSAPLRISMQFFSSDGNRNILRQRSASLKKSIRSWGREIALHKDKISNPEKYYPDWGKFNERQKAGYVKHWEKEIKNFENDISRAVEELRKRGDLDE